MNSNRSPDLAATILRLALGVLYLAHSLQKIFVFTLPGTAHFFESLIDKILPGIGLWSEASVSIYKIASA